MRRTVEVFIFVLIIVLITTGIYVIVVNERNSTICRMNIATLKLCQWFAFPGTNSVEKKIRELSIKTVVPPVKPRADVHSSTATPELEWLDISEGRNFSDYGDSSCQDNPDRGILLLIFQQWLNIAKKHNITYFLTAGSLLGAWRNGDLIPYDSDMDILIDSRDNIKLDAIKDKRGFKESDDRFHLILEEDWREPYVKRRRFMCNGKEVPHYSDECSFQEPLGRLMKGYRHLDIYDYELKKGRLSDPSEWQKEYLEEDIFPLKKCRYMQFETICPKNPKAILHAFYGKILSPNKKCKHGKWVSGKR